ncbi:MAG: CRISPR-associated helicase Cas3', partial [Ktedonobacteraceae bacterium]|nr:CRISPR-associated helicase Cas3' [Ktedonobacteraceae bacterium]
MTTSPQQRELRLFQREVFQCLLRGRNVILQAPTGSGKTDAALYPFIQNLERGGEALPSTCLYATPLRVLSNQFFTTYKDRIERLDRRQGTEFGREYAHLDRLPISIQTGEQPDDPHYESLLTFCTIDQVLAGFLGIPYSVDGRRANINVGAVVGSYLVFDEFHLYPLLGEGAGHESWLGARTTTITLLRLLKNMTRFVVMTATHSDALLERLKVLLDAEIVRVTDADLQQINRGRQRTWALSPVEMNAETILHQHDRCSLVICNTVQRAQECFLRLRERAQTRGIRVVLLHSRFADADRRQQARHLGNLLGPASWDEDTGAYLGENVIVVATQVVEVGLDISVQTLHSEIAPANSLIQRAGRCARFSMQQGRVIVYPLPESGDSDTPVSFLPYDANLCETTWQALADLDGQVVGFREEQQLINRVHTQKDMDLLDRYNHDYVAKQIFASLNQYNRGVATTLIRDVVQVQVIIHDTPEVIETEPWKWQSFGLHPDSLAGRWKALQERAAELHLDWVCKEAKAVPEGPTDEEADSRQKTRYRWEPWPATEETRQISRALRQALIVALPPELATYDRELGFLLLDERLPGIVSTGYQSAPRATGGAGEAEKKRRRASGSKVQSYEEHIAGLVKAYNRGIDRQIRYVCGRLEQELGLAPKSIDHAIRLALACHDLGKLDRVWQQWARTWQQALRASQNHPYTMPGPDFFFAKTDYDFQSQEQRALQRTIQPRRPWHACESVAIGMDLFAQSLGVVDEDSTQVLLLRAVCGAIARHHTSNAHEHRKAHLEQGTLQAIENALLCARGEKTWEYDLSLLTLTLPETDDLAPDNAQSYITRPAQGRDEE